MRVLVIDLEATCWDGQPPEGQYSEIIQVGMATVFPLDDETDVLASRLAPGSVYVKPRVSSVSDFCYNLTGLTNQQVMNGIDFKGAMDILRDIDYDLWGSWGYYDINMLNKESNRKNASCPLRGVSYVNFKTMFALHHNRSPVSVGKALDILGMQFHGRPHDGGDDAYNIARIVRRMLLDKWVKE